MSRRSKEQLRQLMIDAGCELLERKGLAFDPPHLTYATVFAHLEETEGITLHRSQVHGRIWGSQEHYRNDVIAATIANSAPGTSEVDEMVSRLATEEQSVQVRTLATAWIESATAVTRDQLGADLRWDLLVAAMALSGPTGTTPAPVVDVTGQNLAARMEHNEWRYGEVAAGLGVRPDPEFGISPADAHLLLSRNSSALVEGMRLIESIDHPVARPFHIIDEDGNPQVRDPATLALCLMVEQLYGLDAPTDPAGEDDLDETS